MLSRDHLSSATLAAVSMVMLCCWAKLLMMVMIDQRLLSFFLIFAPFDTPLSFQSL
jgi:hypothetical protein